MPGSVNPQGFTFNCAPNSVIPPRRVVVFDAVTRGLVKLPAGTPEKQTAGITRESASPPGNIHCAVAGVAVVESDGSAVINPGDMLIAVGTTGRVKSQAIAAGSANVYGVVGTCVNALQVPATVGALVQILVSPDLTTAA